MYRLLEFAILFFTFTAIDSNRCFTEPRFCLNGGTCEPTRRSARYHCTDRYQGDRCDICAAGYYGDICDWTFVEHPSTDCLNGIDLDALRDISDDIEPCEEWCVGNDQCGGFTTGNGNCNFKGLQCRDDLISDSTVAVYLKETA